MTDFFTLNLLWFDVMRQKTRFKSSLNTSSVDISTYLPFYMLKLLPLLAVNQQWHFDLSDTEDDSWMKSIKKKKKPSMTTFTCSADRASGEEAASAAWFKLSTAEVSSGASGAGSSGNVSNCWTWSSGMMSYTGESGGGGKSASSAWRDACGWSVSPSGGELLGSSLFVTFGTGWGFAESCRLSVFRGAEENFVFSRLCVSVSLTSGRSTHNPKVENRHVSLGENWADSRITAVVSAFLLVTCSGESSLSGPAAESSADDSCFTYCAGT